MKNYFKALFTDGVAAVYFFLLLIAIIAIPIYVFTHNESIYQLCIFGSFWVLFIALEIGIVKEAIKKNK